MVIVPNLTQGRNFLLNVNVNMLQIVVFLVVLEKYLSTDSICAIFFGYKLKVSHHLHICN